MNETEWVQPDSVASAVSFLAAHGGDARLVAGATDLIMETRSKGCAFRYLVSVNKLDELSYIRVTSHGLALGALVRLRELETSPVVRDGYPCIAEAAAHLGSIQIRNLATVAGNLAHASPSAEMAPPLMALDASVEILSARGKRSVPIVDFFAGPGRTVVADDEMITEVLVPQSDLGRGSAYLRFCSREALDIATVNVATALEISEGIVRSARIALGAVGSTPLRARAAEDELIGNAPGAGALARAAVRAREAASPISDVRASAAFRSEMVEVLTRRALEAATRRAERQP